MNLVFPNSTDTLIKLNPRSWPDSVRALLRFQALTGEIREIRGNFYKIRKESDETIEAAHRFHRPRTHKPYRNCAVCGKECSRTRAILCSIACHAIHQTKRKPICKRLGCENPVKKCEKKYCSLSCANLDKVGRPTKMRRGRGISVR